MPPPPINLWRAHGALLGLAIGDALGAPLEFSSPTKAATAAKEGLEMTGGGVWEPGEWTDDTDMALALAESIVESGLIDLDDVAARYIEWADSNPKDIGNTTRAALQGASGAEDARDRARVLHEHTGRTAGNGTVMRCAPIAIAALSREEAQEIAVADALLTHHDPAAGLASAALCAGLMNVADLETPFDSIEEANSVVGDHRELRLALGAAKRRHEPHLAELAKNKLGAAWTALAIGLYAVENFQDFESGVSWAISLGGDTDTNGAVAGALLGCRDGVGGIPERWRSKLQGTERIERACSGLLAGACERANRSLHFGATLWPQHNTELRRINHRPADVRTAVALSRGKLEKSYGHIDDNEDVVIAMAGAQATLLILADGHNGRDSAVLAASYVLDRLGADPPTALSDEEWVELFHSAGEAILAETKAPGARCPESRTTLIVALASHRRLCYAAMGDSALIVTDGAGYRRLDQPRHHFVGYPMTPGEVDERLVRGTEEPGPGEWVIAASDGFTDFAVGGMDAAVAAVAGRPDPFDLSIELVQSAFDGDAGDNIAVACVSPFDSPFSKALRLELPERSSEDG